ncbi:MAG: hypothetical protein Q7U45_11330, partial [Burkholderiaceae bacterium]|nr:hypothetical protein [Burkholderiaceae bacterium]
NPKLVETITEYAEDVINQTKENPFVSIHMRALGLAGALKVIEDDPDKEDLYNIIDEVFQIGGYTIKIEKVES